MSSLLVPVLALWATLLSGALLLSLSLARAAGAADEIGERLGRDQRRRAAQRALAGPDVLLPARALRHG